MEKGRFYVPVPVAILVGAVSVLYACRRAIAFRVMWALQSFNKGIGIEYLSGNFAPVDKEIHVKDLSTEGTIPKELDGWYMKTGPNPHFPPVGGYHWFDGEAMVHSVLIRGGKAKAYSNHWLRTPMFLEEERAGRNLFFRFGDAKGPLGLFLMLFSSKMGLTPSTAVSPQGLDGRVLGNTSLIHYAKRLMALNEGSAPFELRMLCSGLLESIGAMLFGGKLDHHFTAHPKVDPVTGIMHLIGYNLRKAPFMVYNTLSPKGELGEAVPIDVQRPTMVHDFGITEKYAVFLEHNLVFNPKPMAKTKLASPLRTDVTFPGRIGLLSLKAPTEPVRWFDWHPYMVLHVANCWDDGDLVHIVACVFNDVENADIGIMVPEQPYGFSKQVLTRYTVDTKSGTITSAALVPNTTLDFPVVAAQVVGRRSRYCWCAELADIQGIGVVKADMTAAEGKGLAGRIQYPPNTRGGEMVFVPRNGDALAQGTADDDDGFLVGYLTDLNTTESYCAVYDAKTMSSTPLAKISLPQRVPFGFHGTFVPSSLVPQEVSAAV